MGETYTGGILEEELLGRIESEGEVSLKNLKKYIKYRQAIDLVKKIQPKDSDPSDPEPYFASDLFAELAEDLELEDYGNLRYYTAVGSRMDFFHGVDAFFEWELDDGRIVQATVDLTMNSEKEDYKADLVIQVKDDDLDLENNRVAYRDFVVSEAKKIASILRIRRDHI
ncbi:MAG: hypothetical protein WC536_02420 [Patescibacteria group bacterium]